MSVSAPSDACTSNACACANDTTPSGVDPAEAHMHYSHLGFQVDSLLHLDSFEEDTLSTVASTIDSVSEAGEGDLISSSEQSISETGEGVFQAGESARTSSEAPIKNSDPS